jgi:hypothetical protein
LFFCPQISLLWCLHSGKCGCFWGAPFSPEGLLMYASLDSLSR